MNDDAPYWDRARDRFGDDLAHVYVLHGLRQMRVQLSDGTRLLLDERGDQIGRTLPPLTQGARPQLCGEGQRC